MTLISHISVTAEVTVHTDFHFDHLSTNRGLSNSNVRSIFQDSFGYMWIGTQNGLNRYDGYDFTVYQYGAGDKAIPGNTVTEIYEDKSGNLWIGTESGVSIYNRNLDQFEPLKIYNTAGYVFDVDVYEIIESSEGQLVILTNENLFLFKGYKENHCVDGFLSYSVNTFPMKGGRSLIEDNNGVIWIATMGNGLQLFDIKRHSFITDSLKYPVLKYVDDRYLNKIYFDEYNDKIFICSQRSGVYVCGSYVEEPKKISSSSNSEIKLASDLVFDFYTDSRGASWIATSSGLVFYDQKTGEKRHFESSPNTGSLSSNEVRVIFEDFNDNIWLGINRAGIDMLPANTFHSNNKILTHDYFNEESISDFPVLSFLEDGQGRIWVGTDWGGIDVIDHNKVVKKVKHNSESTFSIGSDAVTSMLRDRKGRCWVGCFQGGVQLIDAKSLKVYKKFEVRQDSLGLSHNSIMDIYEAVDGRIWISTSGGGVSRYDPETKLFKHYLCDDTWKGNTISTNFVNQTYDTGGQYVWFATYYGLNRYDKQTGEFRYYLASTKDTASISHNWVYCIAVDHHDNMWLGTANGLNLYQPQSDDFKVFTQKHGLPSNVINGILVDDHNNLWVSTDNGIAKYNAMTTQFDLARFSVDLRNKEYSIGGCFKSSSGNMYFGGPGGVNVFHPDSIEFKHMTSSRVVLTDFRLNNKSVEISREGVLKRSIALTDSLELTSQYKVISFCFAALAEWEKEAVSYQYLLEGFNEHWVNAGEARMATYTNLKPGSYIFKVRGTKDNDFDNAHVREIYLLVKPPFYNTTLSWVIYLFMILCVFYFFRRYTLISVNRKNQFRIDHINKKNSERITQFKLNFFTNVAHEIRTPLTLILGPLNRLKEQSSSKDIVLIANNANKLLKLTNQLLDFHKVTSGKMEVVLYRTDLVDLVRNIVDSFIESAKQRGIELQYYPSHTDCSTCVDVDKVEKICSNLISNAIKYSNTGGVVDIRLQITEPKELNRDDAELFPEGMYSIVVVDKGKGIPEEEQSKIFDRFYTGKGNPNWNSTGIGLSLVKDFCELLKGYVSVSSAVGKGAVFKVVLPMVSGLKDSEINEADGEASFSSLHA